MQYTLKEKAKLELVFFHLALNQQPRGGIVQSLLINLQVNAKSRNDHLLSKATVIRGSNSYCIADALQVCTLAKLESMCLIES